jgi:hypothetical protein
VGARVSRGLRCAPPRDSDDPASGIIREALA